MKTLLALVVLAGLLLLMTRFALPRLGSSVAGGIVSRDGSDALADCPGSPNCAGSMASEAARRTDALPGKGSVQASLDAVESLLAGEPGAQLVRREGAYLHSTFATSLLRFTDDVEFLVDDDGQRIQVRSASRLGKTDLGANAARIERLRAALQAR